MNVLLKRYKELFGFDYTGFSLNLPQTIRVNALLIPVSELIEKLKRKNVSLEKVPFTKSGYSCAGAKFSLGTTTEYLLGYYYLQEAASQVPVEVLSPAPGELVLDMCAAPGGKATQACEYMENKGTIIAMDNNPRRVSALVNNIERMKCQNIAVFQKNAYYAGELGMTFDKVLLDAPCSGNLVVDKKWLDRRKATDFDEMAKQQKSLGKAALSLLKPGGMLLYTTCTMEPEENELVVDYLLSECDLELEPIDINIGDNGLTSVFGKELNKQISLCKRFLPHKTGTQPFFIAKIRKK